MADDGTNEPRRSGRPPLPPEKRKPQLSGAEKRRRKKQAEIAEHLEALKALGWSPDPAPASSGELPGDEVAEAFCNLGPPPLDETETALAWVRKFQLVALHVAATKPLDHATLSRLRWVKDLGATLGMTQSRSDLEEIAGRLEDALLRARPTGAVRVEPVGPDDEPAPRSRGAPRSPKPVE